MISRCLECHSVIFHNRCLCGKTITRCPDCGGDGREKSIELLEDASGYLGYVLQPQKTPCPTCGGTGRVSVKYERIKENINGE